MVTWLFIIVCSSLVVYQRYREGRWLNLFSLLMSPYIVIVFFNNLFVCRLGFFKISDSVLLMLLSAFCVFFSGSLLFKFKIIQFSDFKNKQVLASYNMDAIRSFLYITGILGIIQALICLKNGVLIITDSETETVMGNGPIGHLLLASYSVLPIYFLNWTYNKSFKGIMPVILVLLVAFSSFIKYNIIGPIIIIFIFVCLYRRGMLIKGLTLFPILVLIFFIANYAIGFAFSEVDVPASFYLAHFWKYFAGSLICDNYIFTTGIRVGVSIFYKLMTDLCALPNMFLNKIFGITFYEGSANEMHAVSDFGEDSNVVDAIGGLYPSHGSFEEIIWYYIIMFILGIVVSYLYIKASRKVNGFSTSIAVFLTYFIFLDFFATFFSLAGTWEILVWSIILPPFFKYKKSKYGSFRI